MHLRLAVDYQGLSSNKVALRRTQEYCRPHQILRILGPLQSTRLQTLLVQRLPGRVHFLHTDGEPRGNRIDVDTVFPQLPRQGPGESDHAGFRSDIVGHEWRAIEYGTRANVDDLTL